MAHIHARNRSLPHPDGRAAVACDEPTQELEHIGIVSYGKDRLVAGIFGQKVLEVRVIPVQSQCRADLNLAFVAQFCADQLRRLESAFQWTRYNGVNRGFQCVEYLRHQDALLLALFDQAAFGIQQWVFTNCSGVRMAH